MLDRLVLDEISTLFEREPYTSFQWEHCPPLEIECMAWIFPYEEELNMLDLEARDQMINDRLSQARSVLIKTPYVAYKGGNFMWVHSELSIADQILVLDSDDQFDILRFECTQGNNFPISTINLIESLQGIHKQFGIEIDGAADRAVEFSLGRYLEGEEETNLTSLLTHICPDVFDDFRGFASKRVVLAWD